eukprot:CAMPEP_0196246786 /NCGR_PEP_ID=MMETSP0913-20130531/36616_1 /TAXON_ID=49265 /ORGANISM="Thalassiosira rotula, Strain GSO102" /LENGTH=50 /DNA_ID=CAMNT_0041531523 /DNA_START=13 /DNA_END=162 /DNA_ORIENTATION=-
MARERKKGELCNAGRMKGLSELESSASDLGVKKRRVDDVDVEVNAATGPW